MSRETIRTVRTMTRQLRGLVRGVVRRATIGTLNVAGALQTLQAKLTADDVDDGVEYFEPFGFTSGPVAGSEGLVLRVGGERGHSVAILFGNRTLRPSGVLQGEACMYNALGDTVTVRSTGLIHVGANAVQPAVLGTTLSNAFATWAGTISSALSTLQAVPPPTNLATAITAIEANTAAITAIAGAHATLAASIGGALSTKVAIE